LSDRTVVVICIHIVVVAGAINSSIIFIRVRILIRVAIRIRVGIVASAIDVLVYITVASAVHVLIDRTSACVVIGVRVVCASTHDIVIRVRGGIVVCVVTSTIDRSAIRIRIIVSARVVTGASHGTSIDIRIIVGVRIGIGVDVRVVISIRASIRRRVVVGIGVDIRVVISVRACGGIDVRISICVGIGASYRAGASSRTIGFDITRVVEVSVSVVCDFRKSSLCCIGQHRE